jgi:iron complex outermembrane receptor protein
MLITALLTTVLVTDTVTLDKVSNLDEVLIVSNERGKRTRSVKGQAASIDEHLGELRNVNLVRRGSYAWEPVVNNMQTERLSTTIDGMKIFYACTDKMDPVTSYVESGNLQSISLNSGLDGNPQATGNIGGSLDLKLRKIGFEADPRQINLSAGHEWNGHLQVYGADAAFSGNRAYLNTGVFYRAADCYQVGGGELLNYSQFSKVNLFANAGLRLTETDVLESTVIFDRATDVGYPALNMDVAKAQGFITSLSYKHRFSNAGWETKAYYNHIIHIMDDTTRPDVEIHMDMPGDSWTTGLYSLLTTSVGKEQQHDVAVNYDLYYNRLFADMTMYPGGAAPMYMVTWPDVGTLNTGLALTDNVTVTDNQSLRLSAKVAWQEQRLNNEEGYSGQKVFFPLMTDRYYQTTGRVAAAYQFSILNSQFSIGTGWGSRAPTVTEAYGYYLNNTFDQYDYMGNPHLANESAVELNGAFQYSGSVFTVGLDANAFLFKDYIIGHLDERLSAMTVGAEGVKVYGNLDHATIVNVSLTADWQITERLAWNGKLSYSSGRDDEDDPLPLISPVAWRTRLQYGYGRLQTELELRGNARQVNYAAKYGETETQSWNIVNLSAVYQFSILNSALGPKGRFHKAKGLKEFSIRGGIENLFDKSYSAYSDWNNIPQKGRNVYLNLTFEL